MPDFQLNLWCGLTRHCLTKARFSVSRHNQGAAVSSPPSSVWGGVETALP
jgi:hypothetical protein